jgi:RNA polymerase sigma-70 factor (ECF subfamily)
MSTARTPEQAASDVEVRAVLETAVDALPIAFRTVFVMRAVEEMTVGEVAEALDIPEETVRTRLHRARGMLRNALEQRLDAATPNAFDFHLSRCDRVVDAVLKRIRH